MVHKKRLALLISGIASVAAFASEIKRTEYTERKTEFAQKYTCLFGEEPSNVWNLKKDCMIKCTDCSSGNGGDDKGGSSGNNDGISDKVDVPRGDDKDSGTKK